MQMLARHGVPEYWIVDPIRETIEIYTLAGGGAAAKAPASLDEAPRSRAYSLAETASASRPLRSPLLSGLRFRTERIFPAQPL